MLQIKAFVEKEAHVIDHTLFMAQGYTPLCRNSNNSTVLELKKRELILGNYGKNRGNPKI